MAFVLEKKEDMQNIYEMAKKVYDRQISADEAASLLAKKTEAKTSSLKMYFNIYASMRKGKCYKLGTSAAFTEFLLNQIHLDFGEETVITALSAAKLHSEYRASVNNEQPGIALACRRFIENNSIDVEFDSLPSYQEKGDLDMLSEQERKSLLEAINKPNTEFSTTVMGLVEKYQVFSGEDLDLLCDRYKSRELFSCDYPYLKRVDTRKELGPQLKSADGRNRYYSTVYVLNGNSYVMTSQLYGYGGASSHRDNRKQFFDWVLLKFEIPAEDDAWWPSQAEYPLTLTKEDWKKYIFEVELPNHPSPMKMLKGMLELGGEASCKQLSDTYGGHPSAYAGCAMNLGRRVKKQFGLPACMDGDQERYFPFPFVGKYRGGSEDNYIYRIRPELVAALNEIDLSNISPYYEEERRIGTFDSWEIIDENTAIKTCDKSFFEHNGSGVPKGICWFFDAEDMQPGETKTLLLIYGAKQYSLKVANDSTDRRRVRIFWNAELGKIFNESRNSLVKVAFTKGKPQTYEITLYGGEKEMTIKEKVEAIKAYIADKGFNYEGDLIENFYLSLKSKPFVILAGTSGTGKTRLVKLFAEAIGAEMKLVPVRPDWSDSSDLFGHTDLSNHFHPGAIIDFIKKAEWNKEKPFFLCLDEMNLARVEYYLSDFLSIIETRDRKVNGDIETDPLVDVDYYKDEAAQGKYGRVFIPENLYIIGTVNMDETTFPFSKKVLDRANTIEFSFVNLMAKPIKSFVGPKNLNENNAFLKTEYLYLQDCDDDSMVDAVCFDLEALNQILVKANLHVGYRVRDEILFYMMNNKKADLLSEDAAFDHEIMQKILPRIQGSSAAIKDVLSELFVKCAGDYSGFSGVSAFEQMNSYIEQKDCKYPNSAKKIAFMMRRYEEDGFTSYWL